MITTFSQKLSAHLSSLVPEFEGHSYYIEEDAYTGDGKYGKKIRIVCLGKDEELKLHQQVICPAWQVEDVLRNWCQIAGITEYDVEMDDGPWRKFSNFAAHLLRTSPDTAYQKIEEYLWEILA